MGTCIFLGWAFRTGQGTWTLCHLSEAFIFELLGLTHARGVPAFSARHVRVEAKHAQGKLLKSQWPHGSVTFHDIDYSSQAGSHTYGDIIDIDFQNEDGALYSFRDSVLAGTVRLRGSTDAYRMHKSQVLFDNCKWWFQDKPSDIVNYTVSTNQGGRPIARFRNCMPLGHTHTLGHMAVWDADIGSRNAASAQGEEKIYTLRGDDTTVPTTFSRRVKFPIGTIITKFSAYGRPGGSAETTPVTYSLKSSEGTPTTIAQVSASNPSTARAYAETPTNLPWFCDTTGTADLDVVAEADVGNAHTDLIFVIRYL